MAIPDFQTLMRPVLEEVLQSQPTPIPPLFDTISNKFKLSDEERNQTLNSNSTIYIIGNRIQWAVSYLYKAGLLDRPSRGVYAVSELGKQALKTHTDKINIKTLEQYPKFLEWRNKEKKQSDNGLNIEIEVDSNQTPQEIIEKSYVTTSYFSKDAYDFVSKVHSRIILIDGDELSKLLYEHGIGVRLEMRFDVKKIDEGYFSD